MPSPQPPPRKAFPKETTKELDLYAAEFAKLVDRHTPSRRDAPPAWLRQLPDEAFQYFLKGISSFGSTARTPIERRGRLYLIHTALLFMWMSWGKEKARKRFQTHANQATRRAASLIILEYYRRMGIIADHNTDNWFHQPVGEWTVSLISGAIAPQHVPDKKLRRALRQQPTVECSVERLSELRAANAIPNRNARSLG